MDGAVYYACVRRWLYRHWLHGQLGHTMKNMKHESFICAGVSSSPFVRELAGTTRSWDRAVRLRSSSVLSVPTPHELICTIYTVPYCT